MLRLDGAQIVDEQGQPVQLRGVGLGGWMNMENFITGYPGSEEGWREALLQELGEERYHRFFDLFLEHFFGEDDAAYLASLGLNLVRLPINYRHFERDDRPFEIDLDGFRHLDRAIETCARHGIYTVVDLHAVPGYQNQDWHSDNPTHKALLWRHRHFQDRAVHLWETIAERYRGNRWMAGYNLMNEPNDPSGEMLVPFTRRLYDAVRAIDSEHLIFVDGNRYSSDFSLFTEAWPDVVYSPHDYALCGFNDAGPYPGYSGTVWCDKAFLEKHFLRKTTFAREHGAPSWIGEFGPVYRNEPEIDGMRLQVAADQIEIFDRYGAHWAIWTYKDIGLQGLLVAAPDSPWMQRLRPALEKKARLGADSWGATDYGIRDVMEPLEQLLETEFPNWDPHVFNPKWMAHRFVRHILISEALLPDFAACFRGVTDGELEDLAKSFAFDRCVKREGLAAVLGRQPIPA